MANRTKVRWRRRKEKNKEELKYSIPFSPSAPSRLVSLIVLFSLSNLIVVSGWAIKSKAVRALSAKVKNLPNLINRDVQARIARKLLLNEEFIEQSLRKNLVMGEPMNSCFDAMSWLDKKSNSNKGFNRAYTLQTVRSSEDGSMVHGVFKIDGNWYRSSFKTGRLYFDYWGTGVGCIANMADENIGDLLNRFHATTYTHLKAEFCSVFGDEYHNNAFFSWKGSDCYGCIRHKAINNNTTEPIVDSVFYIKKHKEDFLEITRPYFIIPDRSEANQNVNH
jgi:hypothetical protein